MKKITKILLLVLMISGILHVGVKADVRSGNYYYIVSNGTAILTKYQGSATTVIIPSDIDGYTVTGLQNTFLGNRKITNVTIPDTVSEIGGYAFKDCVKLQTVNFPDSLRTIGEYAFYRCFNISENNLIMPKLLTYIGEYAFDRTYIKSITLPDSVSYVSEYAFGSSITIYGTCHSIAACTQLKAKNSLIKLCNTTEKKVVDRAVAATNTTAGKTAGSHCSYCGKIFVAQKTIPAISKVILYKGVNKKYKLTSAKKASWIITKGKTNVSLKGNIVTIKKSGAVKVYDKNSKKTVTITIKKPALSVSKSKISLNVGSTYQLTAKAAPTAVIRWSSSKKSVATVTAGKITAKKAGSCYIYAKANSVTKKIKITVKKVKATKNKSNSSTTSRKKTLCDYCFGSGTCYKCGGRGDCVYCFGTNRRNGKICMYCAGGNCSRCYGSGTCQICSGTGYRNAR